MAHMLSPRRFAFACGTALLAVAALAACSGGSTTPPPFSTGTPAPTATPTPRVVSAHLSWIGVAHSSTTSATGARRLPFATASAEPIEVGVQPSDPHAFAATSSEAAVGVDVSFTDQNGSPAPAPSGSPSVTITNTAIASTIPAATSTPNPSASPGPVPVAVVSGGGSSGTTTLTVTYPGATASSIGVTTYTDPTLECPAANHPGSVEGIVIASGFTPASSASADLYLTGPACADKSTSATTLHAPQGFQVYSNATPVSSIVTAVPFSPSGSMITVSTLMLSPSTYGVLIVKGASGDYGKFRIGATQCNGDSTLCDIVGAIGTFAVFGPTGAFPY